MEPCPPSRRSAISTTAMPPKPIRKPCSEDAAETLMYQGKTGCCWRIPKGRSSQQLDQRFLCQIVAVACPRQCVGHFQASVLEMATTVGTEWAQRGHGQIRAPTGRRCWESSGHKKAREFAGLDDSPTGGYGWTRTTDPSIMSAVL